MQRMIPRSTEIRRSSTHIKGEWPQFQLIWPRFAFKWPQLTPQMAVQSQFPTLQTPQLIKFSGDYQE